MRIPEVLAPVGSPACLPAAVAGGADAVYLGMRHFNARGRAENFRTTELRHHVTYLHDHGVKCYVVMNTLVHDDEYAKAMTLATAAADAGVDAAIIQDLGLWDALSREVPHLKRHASTQMTIHDPEQVAVLAKLGAERVILARELSLAEVDACTRRAADLGIETEHFVHGALCYAFSGQCLMSNFAGCRSANRGTCAQNCRFDYSSDQSEQQSTVLSMRDFALVDRIGDLADIGVASLKIEGRLKTPEYVYTVSRVYRDAVDAWKAGKAFDSAQARERLREVFARPFTAAPLEGVYDTSSRLNRWEAAQDGVADASLMRWDRQQGRAEIAAPLVQAGMGFAYTHGKWNGGFLITAADLIKPGLWRCKIRGDAGGPPLPEGLPLRKNVDHARRVEAQAAMATVAVAPAPEPSVGVRLSVFGQQGTPLTVRMVVNDGRQAEAATEAVIQPARGAALDIPRLTETLGALGGTGFHLAHIDLDLPPDAFVPAAQLKALRRHVVELVQQLPVPAAATPWSPPAPGTARLRSAGLWVAVSSLAAARAALDAGAAQVWYDDPCLDLWGESAPQLATESFAPGSLWLRHPATVHTSPHLKAIGLPVVAGQLGALVAAHAAGLPVTADHFCNAFGWSTMRALGALGAGASVASLECSAREVARLMARLGATDQAMPQVGIVVHGRVPSMLTRQDHGLKPGEQRTIQAAAHDGGLPYTMERRIGGDTVIWEARQLCAPEQAALTRQLVDGWVLELGGQTPDAVAEITKSYCALRDGALQPEQLRGQLQSHAGYGFFHGHLERGSRELDLVVAQSEGEN